MKLLIRGVVQGVGFRPAVVRIARSMGLKGYVQNRGSYVEVYVEEREKEFADALLKNLPPLAKVDDIEYVNEPPSHEYSDFSIVRSEDGYRSSIIPPDTAICPECLHELFDPGDRRYLFPFINCTNCGARFTAIYELPYDRKNTSMADFPMCGDCMDEYMDEGDRRFHAQTTSCHVCGPRYILYDAHGEVLDADNPIKKYAEMMDDGLIGVMKSWGGMHITAVPEQAGRLREWYRRPQKPFALMVRDMESAETYGVINEDEREALLSPQRPIVLLEKREEWGEISPGLPNIGIYLPYSAAHHILFHYLRADALIMTSANIPGEPMMTENKEAFRLGAEAYLLHNRKIANRADDSLMRIYDGKRQFIRRSRGFVPVAFPVPYKKEFIGVGAEMNLSFTLSKDGKLYGSQYIGNVSRLGNYEYMEEMMEKFLRWLDVRDVRAVGMDIHPKYASRRLAKALAERYGAELMEIQHHWAHVAALAGEHEMEELVAMSLDGTGYGTDGNSWGGEVIYSCGSGFERIGHLEEIPLIGGDRAVIEPLRLVFAWSERLGIDMQIYDGEKSEVLRKISRTSIKTTSFGRFLDALSAYLGICSYRSYDGEPAMKLERYLKNGRDLGFPVETEGDTVLLSPIFEEVFSGKAEKEQDRANIAYSAVKAALKGLLELAMEDAERRNISSIGITGGVSYNGTILKIVEKELGRNGFTMPVHDFIPNGDGGIAYGQNFILAKTYED